MIEIDQQMTPATLSAKIQRLWELAGTKIAAIESAADRIEGTPVFTVDGEYVKQGWTEWTQGFQFGCQLLQFDATDDRQFLDMGRSNTLGKMAAHISHIGVHDHGFNQVSTYGNLRRLALENRFDVDPAECQLYDLALQISGAVQAARWSTVADGSGYIYSFNGPHSLFCDTIRSLRSLALAHLLGHRLFGENDRCISLLQRLIQHARNTANFSVYYGQDRDIYDLPGRVAHESIFNTNDGQYRCPSTQQGYSPFTTWTRGLAWIMLGYAEQLEYLRIVDDAELVDEGGRVQIEAWMRKAAQAACNFYIEQTPVCGVPYWDTGAPGLSKLPEHRSRPADPDNRHEPVDSSAAAIAAQGLMRLGKYLNDNDSHAGQRFFQAGLTVLSTLLDEPYLSTAPNHEGLLLHSIYHRPRGWDYVPDGAATPRGESSLWGDYHLMEAALYVQRCDGEYLTFFGRGNPMANV